MDIVKKEKLQNSLTKSRSKIKQLLSNGGFLGIVLYTVFFNESFLFPGISSASVCIFTLAVILFSHNSLAGWILTRKLVVFIGEISYSVYLIHWPLLVLAEYKLGGRTTWCKRLFAVFLSIPLGYVLNQCVEMKFQDAKDQAQGRSNRRTLFTCALFVSIILQGLLAQSDQRIFGSSVSKWDPQLENALRHSKALFKKRSIDVRWYGDPTCHTNRQVHLPMTKCHPRSEKELGLVGDSHAADFYSAFKSFRDDVGVIQYTGSSGGSRGFFVGGRHNKHCGVMFDSLRDQFIHRKETIFAAVIISKWERHMKGDHITRLRRTIEFFRDEVNAKVFVLGPRLTYKIAPLFPFETASRETRRRQTWRD